MQIKIDPEFRSLIPPLKPEEREQLKANIMAEGVREPLIIWNGIIIDGHNRYEIANECGIGYETKTADIIDREAALLWIYENQLGRRNLSDDQRSALAYKAKNQRSKVARTKQAKEAAESRWQKKELCVLDDVVQHASVVAQTKRDTRAEVAKEYAVPVRKIKQVRAIEMAAPEMLKDIIDGKKTLAEATREIKRAEIVDKLNNVANLEQKRLEGKYDVIVIDPPWPMEKIERDTRPNQAEFEYPTMSLDDIGNMTMPAAEDCHLWLWTTHKFLPAAIDILKKWGFVYVCTFVWHKPGGFQPIGLPQYNCEFALYARNGTPKFVDTKALPTCFNAPRGDHSEKPEDFYDVIRRVTAGRRIDIFNRRKIEGFDTWGKEAK